MLIRAAFLPASVDPSAIGAWFDTGMQVVKKQGWHDYVPDEEVQQMLYKPNTPRLNLWDEWRVSKHGTWEHRWIPPEEIAPPTTP